MKGPEVKQVSILKVQGKDLSPESDVLATEEPLQISISIPEAKSPVQSKNISITMRTPGNDSHLAVGFLFTEGILKTPSQILKILNATNSVDVILNAHPVIDLSRLEKHFYTSSSCGVCGKASIEMIKTEPQFLKTNVRLEVTAETLKSLPSKLKGHQELFKSTGGLHGAALCTPEGGIEYLFEDVGRHNALDKLLGHAFIEDRIPLTNRLLLLSGRASFELIQKAVMAGIPMVVAIGAPSSLAVELAKEYDITLIGFLNAQRFNIYHDKKRILF